MDDIDFEEDYGSVEPRGQPTKSAVSYRVVMFWKGPALSASSSRLWSCNRMVRLSGETLTSYASALSIICYRELLAHLYPEARWQRQTATEMGCTVCRPR